jgi:hypothetical protein
MIMLSNRTVLGCVAEEILPGVSKARATFIVSVQKFKGKTLPSFAKSGTVYPSKQCNIPEYLTLSSNNAVRTSDLPVVCEACK